MLNSQLSHLSSPVSSDSDPSSELNLPFLLLSFANLFLCRRFRFRSLNLQRISRSSQRAKQQLELGVRLTFFCSICFALIFSLIFSIFRFFFSTFLNFFSLFVSRSLIPAESFLTSSVSSRIEAREILVRRLTISCRVEARESRAFEREVRFDVSLSVREGSGGGRARRCKRQ